MIEKKKKYEKPAFRKIELRSRRMVILCGSPTPKYNPFNDEKDW